MLSLTRKTQEPEPVKALTPAQVERAKEAERIALEADIRLQELQEEAAFQAELRAKARDQERAKLAQTDKDTRTTKRADVAQVWAARFVPFMPLVLVNALAVFGQLGWGRHNLTQVGENADSLSRWMIAILFAATLESIALFLAFYANRALDRGDSATALYLGAFGVAAIVAGVNYSHYAHPKDTFSLVGLADIPSPTAMGIVFALCSLASPWLWRIKHRDANRAKLHELGVIDTKAVRLSMARKLWHPVRSFMVMWYATWDGEQEPAKAVLKYEVIQAERRAHRENKAHTKAALAMAKENGPTSTEKPAEAAPAPATQTPAVAAPVAPPALPAAPAVALPAEAKTWPAAWRAFGESVEAGNPLSQRKLAQYHLNKNRRHAETLMGAYKAWKEATQNVNAPSAATP